MGFCGCNLYVSTITAAIFGIIISIFGITWKSIFLHLPNYEFSSSKYLNEILIRLAFLYLHKAVKAIVITSLVIYVLWALSSFLLIIGNKRKISYILRCWNLITALVIISDISFTIYFLVMAFKDISIEHLDLANFWKYENIKLSSFVIISILFDQGIIILCILIALIVSVNRRVNEISKEIREANTINQSNIQRTSIHTSQNMDYPTPIHTKYLPQINTVQNNSSQRSVSHFSQHTYDRNNYPAPQYNIYDRNNYPAPHYNTSDRNNYPAPHYNTSDRNNYPAPHYNTYDRNNYPAPQYNTYDRNNYNDHYSVHPHSSKEEGFFQFQIPGERLPEPEIDYDIDRNKSSYMRGYKRY